MRVVIEIDCSNDSFMKYGIKHELKKVLKDVPGKVMQLRRTSTQGIITNEDGDTVGRIEVHE